ncbi:hypothetical protein FACS1894211_03990 [Clostridia bacterium]|nr:hypothetical protein FACS1894211_03990 [Clostridia bacterium]
MINSVGKKRILRFAISAAVALLSIVALVIACIILEAPIRQAAPTDVAAGSGVSFLGDTFVSAPHNGTAVSAYGADGGKKWETPLSSEVVSLHRAAPYLAVSLQNKHVVLLSENGAVVWEYDLKYNVKNIAYRPEFCKLIISASVTSTQNYLFAFEDIADFSAVTGFTYYYSADATPAGVGIDPKNGDFWYAEYNANLYRLSRDGLTQNGISKAVFISAHTPQSFFISDGGLFVFGAQNGNLNIYNSAFAPVYAKKLANARLNLVYGGGGKALSVANNGSLAFIELGEKVKVSAAGGISSAVGFDYSASGVAVLSSDKALAFYDSENANAVAACKVMKPVALVLTVLSALVMLVCYLTLFHSFGDKVAAAFRGLGKGMYKSKKYYLMLLPAFAFLAVFVYYPVAWGFSIAFQRYENGVFAEWVGFANFAGIFKNTYFTGGIKNMLLFLVTDLLKATIMPVLIAELIISMRSKRSQYWSRILMYIPGILPGVASTLIWVTGIYGSGGLMNQIFGAFGSAEYASFNFLGSVKTAMPSLIFMGFPWVGSYIIIYGALMSIPPSLYEAAKLDGCGRFRRVFAIDLPMIFAQMKYLFVTTFVGSMQDFNRVYLTTEGGPMGATYVPALELFKNINNLKDYGAAAAMGIFLFVIIFTGSMVLLNVKKSKEGPMV